MVVCGLAVGLLWADCCGLKCMRSRLVVGWIASALPGWLLVASPAVVALVISCFGVGGIRSVCVCGSV